MPGNLRSMGLPSLVLSLEFMHISLGVGVVAGHFNPGIFDPKLFHPWLFYPWLFHPGIVQSRTSLTSYLFNPRLFQPKTFEKKKLWNPRLFHHRILPFLNPRLFNRELWGWKAKTWKSGVEAWIKNSGLKWFATLWVMSREISVDITLARCGSLMNRKSKTTLGQIRHLVDTKKKKSSLQGVLRNC